MAELREPENGIVGDVYLSRDADRGADRESSATEIATAYADLDPILIAPLKSSVVFLADLTRALRIPHTLDVDRARAVHRRPGRCASGCSRTSTRRSTDRHVLLVEDVVDTGLTLHFLCRTLALRDPASLAAVTLLDRPYRRLVDELPLRFVGFTVPDELFAGYGLGLDERWRALPDLHVVSSVALPRAATEAA